MHGRKRISILATLALALTGLLVAVPNSATAEPDIDDVRTKVERLEHEAEIASENYNDAKVRAVDLKTRLDSLNADLKRQQSVVDSLRLEVATSVVDQFQGSALSTSEQMMLSDDPDAFIDNLNAISTYNSQQGRMLGDYGVEMRRLALRKSAVGDEARKLDSLQRRMLKEKERIDEKSAKAQEVLDGLEAEVRAQLMGSQYTGDLPDVPASGRAGAALKYAMAQVGDAYVWGAAGPDAFDCSGFTMMAWGAAGVGLPHSSRAQAGYGRSVSRDDLQPGDLVFFYSPISHVDIYIGNGMVVGAQNPRDGVRVVPLSSMPFAGAVRPG